MTKIILLLTIFGIIIGLSNCAVIREGKINIYTDQDGMHCGSLICPRDSRCILTQKNSEKDKTHIVTREKCFDGDDNLLKQNESTEIDANIGLVNRRYEVSGGGIRITDPAKAKEIQENIEKTLKNVFSTPLFTGGLLGDNWPFGNRNNPFGSNFPFYSIDKELTDDSSQVSKSSSVDGNKESTKEELEIDNDHNDVNL